MPNTERQERKKRKKKGYNNKFYGLKLPLKPISHLFPKMKIKKINYQIFLLKSVKSIHYSLDSLSEDGSIKSLYRKVQQKPSNITF